MDQVSGVNEDLLIHRAAANLAERAMTRRPVFLKRLAVNTTILIVLPSHDFSAKGYFQKDGIGAYSLQQKA